jgi:hypothetical protein
VRGGRRSPLRPAFAFGRRFSLCLAAPRGLGPLDPAHAARLPLEGDAHATGHAALVPAMCRAAVAAGAHGLLVECHTDPEHALSDGAQSITPGVLRKEMPILRQIARAVGRNLQAVQLTSRHRFEPAPEAALGRSGCKKPARRSTGMMMAQSAAAQRHAE